MLVSTKTKPGNSPVLNVPRVTSPTSTVLLFVNLVLKVSTELFVVGQNKFSLRQNKFSQRQLDTSPTQSGGKVGARSWARSGQRWGRVGARSGQKARFVHRHGLGRQGLNKTIKFSIKQ